MKLRQIRFGPVLGASGVHNFFGEGYPYHRWLKLALPLHFRFDGMTFVAKTTTLHKTEGNMPMRDDGVTPQEFHPRCIVVKPYHGVALNAVGLSGPGAADLFERGLWQARTEPFMLSFMSTKPTPDERIVEAIDFFKLLEEYLDYFNAPIALQANFSCPNVKLDPNKLIAEAASVLDEARRIKVLLVPKFNALIPVAAAKKIADHPNCAGLCVSNTIPWKDLPASWQIKYFGDVVSPLVEFGGGGLSGAPLLPLVVDWVRQARTVGITKPINAGGGILHPNNIWELKAAGADSVFLGSVTMLRPWRMAQLIQTAYQAFGR
ncbi:MAG: hypothetical protein HUU49_04665 [Candidatus Buchananbacteria bacterium]|nr:hypothetical protein [Candidatus Buchananbacteria bacterium]